MEDAKATMELYKVVEEEWERTLASTSWPTYFYIWKCKINSAQSPLNLKMFYSEIQVIHEKNKVQFLLALLVKAVV